MRWTNQITNKHVVEIALKYTFFAAIATVVNLLGQETSLRLYSASYAVLLSVIVGTIVGLLTKYVLDKKYIFQFRAKNVQHDISTLILYTGMGLFTTVIFWAFEFGFEYQFQTKPMRYLGAVLGLSIGYYVKYRLDKRFVFVAREP
jgi:putative flippase GtrA